MSKPRANGTMVAGLSVLGALLTGTVGLIGGVLKRSDTAGGLYLLAAAIAFGALANAVFRR